MAHELPSMTLSAAKEFITADKNDMNEFMKALTNEDELGMVIRAHIQLESVLQEFIRLSAPVPTAVRFNSMDFDQMLNLALILGLRGALKPSLSAIGKLRNKFAHKPKTKLDDEAALALYNTLDQRCKDGVQKLYQSTVAKGRAPKDFKKSHPKGRIALCLVAVRSSLRVELAARTHSFGKAPIL